jgi:hypothetical protein
MLYIGLLRKSGRKLEIFQNDDGMNLHSRAFHPGNLIHGGNSSTEGKVCIKFWRSFEIFLTVQFHSLEDVKSCRKSLFTLK